MYDIPEQAVQAAATCYLERTVSINETASSLARAILTDAAPHLAAVRVNSAKIEAARKAVEELANVQMDLPLEEWSRLSSVILSALEPSAGKAAALEEAAQVVEVKLTQAMTGQSVVGRMLHALDGKLIREIAAAIRALHPVADKPSDDGAQGEVDVLEQFWRPIAEADKSITFEQTYDLGDGKSMTIRNSDHYWVRDADGRVYEATWSDHKAGYWWDLEGESPVDPVEYMPHPLSLPTPPAGEVA